MLIITTLPRIYKNVTVISNFMHLEISRNRRVNSHFGNENSTHFCLQSRFPVVSYLRNYSCKITNIVSETLNFNFRKLKQK